MVLHLLLLQSALLKYCCFSTQYTVQGNFYLCKGVTLLRMCMLKGFVENGGNCPKAVH